MYEIKIIHFIKTMQNLLQLINATAGENLAEGGRGHVLIRYVGLVALVGDTFRHYSEQNEQSVTHAAYDRYLLAVQICDHHA